MCRLFGFRSNAPAQVHTALVTERNSLRHQSLEHKDGWGIAYYDAAMRPTLAHGLGAAHQDPDFERVSSRVSAQSVVAHVRLASVGSVREVNAHPFVRGTWTFCHNGTLRQFQAHAAELEQHILPDLRAEIRGETDSERCFYLFLSFLGAVDVNTVTSEEVARALVRTVDVARECMDKPPVEVASSMNFLVCNGPLMVATRRNRTLFFLAKDARQRLLSTRAQTGDTLGELVLASEELWGECPWHAVPEDHVVSVDEAMVFREWSFSALRASTR